MRTRGLTTRCSGPPPRSHSLGLLRLCLVGAAERERKLTSKVLH